MSAKAWLDRGHEDAHVDAAVAGHHQRLLERVVGDEVGRDDPDPLFGGENRHQDRVQQRVVGHVRPGGNHLQHGLVRLDAGNRKVAGDCEVFPLGKPPVRAKNLVELPGGRAFDHKRQVLPGRRLRRQGHIVGRDVHASGQRSPAVGDGDLAMIPQIGPPEKRDVDRRIEDRELAAGADQGRVEASRGPERPYAVHQQANLQSFRGPLGQAAQDLPANLVAAEDERFHVDRPLGSVHQLQQGLQSFDPGRAERHAVSRGRAGMP